MKVFIDGEEIEGFKDEIELREDDVIIGCNCNGGTHSEEMGSHVITITRDEICFGIYEHNGDLKDSCSIFIEDLISEMDKTKIIYHNKEEINQIQQLLDN